MVQHRGTDPPIGERMDTPENTMSVGGQHALRDMLELQMYLVARSQRTPWPLLRRGTKRTDEGHVG